MVLLKNGPFPHIFGIFIFYCTYPCWIALVYSYISIRGGTRVAHGWSEYDSYFRTRKAKEGDCFRVVAHSLGSKRLNLILIHTITQLLRTRVFIIKIICTKTHCQALKFLVVGGFFRANGVIFFKLQIEIGQTYF